MINMILQVQPCALSTFKIAVYIVFIFVLTLSFNTQADDEVGRIEIHTFGSMTMTDQQFLQGQSSGVPVTLAGELRYPRIKKDQYPAVLLVHGSGGISGYIDDWASTLNQAGIATFIVDSFTGRGIDKVNNNQALLGRLAQIIDAYRALDVLAKQKKIDKTRIALMGFSRGGQVALYSSLKRFHKLQGTGSDNDFSAYLAFYPSCVTRYKEDTDIVKKPIRIYHGTADNYNPIAPCRKYVQQLIANGNNVELHEYAGAYHVFDYRKLTKPLVLKKAQTTRNCVLAEVDDGKIINTRTGERFEYTDNCVEYGPTIAFNESAYKQSREDVLSFLNTKFGLE